MKQIKKIGFYCTLALALGFAITSIFRVDITEEVISINNLTKQMNSIYLTYDSKNNKPSLDILPLKEEPKELVIKEEPKKEELPPIIKEEVIIEEVPKEDPVINITDPILETITGTLSGYGPDCYGCTSNKTASGYYVGEGNINYNDATYGSVRIVAGDIKYPFGTIIKINSNNLTDTVLAIVLDRGGAIGVGKKFLFDLLYAKEKDCNGVAYGTSFEILRLGY